MAARGETAAGQPSLQFSRLSAASTFLSSKLTSASAVSLVGVGVSLVGGPSDSPDSDEYRAADERALARARAPSRAVTTSGLTSRIWGSDSRATEMRADADERARARAPSRALGVPPSAMSV